MACSLSPSVTLWGTTQIVQTSSYYTTWTTASPQMSGVDVADGKPELKGPLQTQTLSSLVETVVTVPSVVPQRTLYYPCTETQGPAPAPASSQTSTTAAAPAPSTTQAPAAHMTTPSPVTSSSTRMAGASTTSSTALNTVHVGIQSTLTGGTTRRPPTSSVSGSSNAETAVSSAADPSDTAVAGAGTSGTDTTSPSTVPLAGGIAGAVVGIILLVLLLLWCRRRRQRKEADKWDDDIFAEKPAAGERETDGDYWERKFQEIESETISPQGAARGRTSPQSLAASETKRVRLTLDLHSKRLTNRPLSTLTAISAFFARTLPVASRPAGPEPVNREVAEDPDGQKYNYSRPIRAVNADPVPGTNAGVRPVDEVSSPESSRPSSPFERASRLSQIVPVSFKRISTTFASSPFDPFMAQTSGNVETGTLRAPNEARSNPYAVEWVQTVYDDQGHNQNLGRDVRQPGGTFAAAAHPRHQGRTGPVPPRPRRDERRPAEPKDRDVTQSAQDKRDKSRRQLEADQRQELAMDIGGDRRPSVTSLGGSMRLAPMYTEPLKGSDDEPASRSATDRASTATFGPSQASSPGTLTPPRVTHRPPQLALSRSNSSDPNKNRISLYEAGVSVFSPDTEAGPNGPRNSFEPGLDEADDHVSVNGGPNRSSNPFSQTRKVRWLSGGSK